MMNRKYNGRTKKPPFGVGYVEPTYKIADKETDWFCPYYLRWYSMLSRCYSKRVLKERPTYDRFTVCESWLNFSDFRSWMEQQDWEGKDLDKDILNSINNTNEYSPENCAFINRTLNSFFTLRQNHRGAYPLGVTFNKQGHSYVSRLNKPKGRIRLGYFKTPEEAHRAWQQAKLDYGRELQSEQTDQRVFDGLGVILNRLEQDILEGNITERLV